MSSDSQDFVAVYDEHVWDVYGFFGYRLSSRAEAEDLSRSTFERALRAWDRFDPERASARTWLMAIARNLLIDHYRRGSRRGRGAAPRRRAGRSPSSAATTATTSASASPPSSRRRSTSSTSASAS